MTPQEAEKRVHEAIEELYLRPIPEIVTPAKQAARDLRKACAGAVEEAIGAGNMLTHRAVAAILHNKERISKEGK